MEPGGSTLTPSANQTGRESGRVGSVLDVDGQTGRVRELGHAQASG